MTYGENPYDNIIAELHDAVNGELATAVYGAPTMSPNVVQDLVAAAAFAHGLRRAWTRHGDPWTKLYFEPFTTHLRSAVVCDRDALSESALSAISRCVNLKWLLEPVAAIEAASADASPDNANDETDEPGTD